LKLQTEMPDNAFLGPSGPDAALWGADDEEQIIGDFSVKAAV
jgi:hypothetical protein